MNTSEKELGQMIKQRDRRGIQWLYDHYGDVLYGIALKIVRTEDVAQDVLQEAFIKIWKNGAAYDPEKGTVFTWALNITRNLAIDHIRSANYRHRARMEQIEGALVTLDSARHTENNPDVIGLDKEVNRLEPKYQEVIDLIYFRGYTQAEVKDLLNIPLGTVKSRIRIGLRELRKVFSIYRAPVLLWSTYHLADRYYLMII